MLAINEAGPAKRAASPGARRLTSMPATSGASTVASTSEAIGQGLMWSGFWSVRPSSSTASGMNSDGNRSGADLQSDRVGGFAVRLDLLLGQNGRNRRDGERHQRHFHRLGQVEPPGHRRRDDRHDDVHRQHRAHEQTWPAQEMGRVGETGLEADREHGKDDAGFERQKNQALQGHGSLGLSRRRCGGKRKGGGLERSQM